MTIDLATARLHLRVDGTTEDALITLYCAAAQDIATVYLNRDVYASQVLLDAAIALVPAALTAATTAYLANVILADLIADAGDKVIQLKHLRAVLNDARNAGKATRNGMVTNSAISAAMLLTIGHLYSNREDVLVGATVAALPFGSRCLLDPYRVSPGL